MHAFARAEASIHEAEAALGRGEYEIAAAHVAATRDALRDAKGGSAKRARVGGGDGEGGGGRKRFGPRVFAHCAVRGAATRQNGAEKSAGSGRLTDRYSTAALLPFRGWFKLAVTRTHTTRNFPPEHRRSIKTSPLSFSAWRRGCAVLPLPSPWHCVG